MGKPRTIRKELWTGIAILCFAVCALFPFAVPIFADAVDSGTNTASATSSDGFFSVQINWRTADNTNGAKAYNDVSIFGEIWEMITSPTQYGTYPETDYNNYPSEDYDIILNDRAGFDLMGGNTANQTSITATRTVLTTTRLCFGPVDLEVSNTGTSTSGFVIIQGKGRVVVK